MMPPGYQVDAGFTSLRESWSVPPHHGGDPVPPSLELYVEAVRRANSGGRVTSPADVTRSLLAGRWPTNPEPPR